MQNTAAQPASPDARPLTPEDPAAEIARLQARLDELHSGRSAMALQPVTFRCLGAGAQRARGDDSQVLFTFPVHAGKCVRIAADSDTARQFADSLVETLGGWESFRARKLKRGPGRGAQGRRQNAEG